MPDKIVTINSRILLERLAEQKVRVVDHYHFNTYRSWKQRDMCAHQEIGTIDCKVSNLKEFICDYCGISDPHIKPEARDEAWYTTVLDQKQLETRFI